MEKSRKGDLLPPLQKIAIINRAKVHYPREALAQVLRDYQQSVGNLYPQVEVHLDRLAQPGSLCVVTGQQVGFATGPLYTLLKAIHCVRLARREGMIPMFWAHTDDHDTGEVSHATLLSDSGDLHRRGVSLPTGRFVEDLRWNEQHQQALASFMQEVSIVPKMWQDITIGATRYAQVMIALLARLLEGSGLVFLEPHLLRPFAVDFYAQEIQRAAEFRHQLQECAPSLRIVEGGTNLFYKDKEGRRLKIMQGGEGFVAAEQSWSCKELIHNIHDHPQRFSANVAARPLLQSAVIPTATYLAGPQEFQYLTELNPYYRLCRIPPPQLVRRLSATLIPPWAQRLLAHLDLAPSEVLLDGPSLAKQNSRALETRQAPARMHALRNLLRPRGKPQERVLNAWQFVALQPEWIRDLIEASIDESQPIYWNLNEP